MTPGLSPNRFYARAFALVTAATLGVLLYLTLRPFTGAILWSVLLAYMMQPLMARLNARWRRPMLSAGLLTATTTLVVAGPVTLFIFALIRQASDLLKSFQAEALSRKLPALQLVLELGPMPALLEKVGELTALTKDQIIASAAEAAQGVLQPFASLSGTLLVGAFTSLTQFGLTMFLLFFLLRDGRQMIGLAVRLVPLREARKEELTNHLGRVTRAVVMGTLITSAVQGTLVGIGFAIAGLPSPLVFAALGALASLVPVVGTTLVWVPAVVTLIAQGQTGWGIFLAVWCALLVAGSDNVVRPLVISGQSNVSALHVFLGVLGGVGTFGFAGIFMGPLLLTLVAALLRFADESRVAKTSGAQEAVKPPDRPPQSAAPPPPAPPATAPPPAAGPGPA